MGYPKDIVPWHRGDFDSRAAHVHASLPATIVRDAKFLYDSLPVAALGNARGRTRPIAGTLTLQALLLP